MINIMLPDGSKMPFESPVSALKVAEQISPNLAKAAVAAKINDTLTDLTTNITTDSTLSILTTKNPESLEVLRHTTAHILAQAVEALYPKAKATIGPAIENGFYYDFFGIILKEDDLPKIEAKMAEIIAANLPITRSVVSRKEAKEIFTKRGETFKVELIDDLPEDVKEVSLYTQGDYVELCRGPHLPSTGRAGKSFKLTKVAAAYWRGDSSRESLQRVYGTAFWTDKELKAYFTLLEEAEKRDHRKIGKALDLFYFDPTAPGCPYWLPKGLKMYNLLLDYWRKVHEKAGYQEFAGPLMNSKVLWETSGHWTHYKDDMYQLTATEMAENEVYALKPMSCPSTMLLFNLKTRSYQDLPIRFSDVDMIHRNEASGALNGMFRVREFHQDDAHIFITEDQIEEEYERLFALADQFYKLFGMKYEMKLSTRPDDFIGDVETWDRAEAALRRILDKHCGEGKYAIKEKDGAFYGPKVDIAMKDALGREWQTGTFQLDFQLAGRFGCKYIDKDGNAKTPVVVHRTIYGSLARFMGVLTEHF
ncbi:MAG: threonine--tRNA ligase, partial [Alphaproteobacteria bacterium]|nr:threonine--tRNA ligase [Alphaproteobacteria bacterium]